jgi:hypothetical protein
VYGVEADAVPFWAEFVVRHPILTLGMWSLEFVAFVSTGRTLAGPAEHDPAIVFRSRRPMHRSRRSHQRVGPFPMANVITN